MRLFVGAAVLLAWLGGCGERPGTAGATAPEAAPAPAQQDRLTAEAMSIDYQVGQTLNKGAWTLNATLNPDILTVPLDRGERKEACFISGPNKLCRTVGIGESHDFIVTHAGVDYPTRITGAYVPPMARFDAAYQAAHRGKVRLEIPEAYELVNIAIALTPTAQESRWLVYKDNDYYRDVMRQFGPLKDHPFVQALEKDMKAGKYARVKMNGYSFEFGPDGKLARSQIYDRTGFNGSTENDLLPHFELMQDFAARSDFRRFYAAHKPLYQQQIGYYRTGVDLDGMLTWLRAQFPAVKPYDTINIIFSPLVSSSQSVTWMESNGFRELQPHINFPYRRPEDDKLSPQSVALRHGYIAFTELNHGFINPTADQYAGRITKALDNRPYWALPNETTKGYGNALSVFNEMMNWGLISLYLVDKAPAHELDGLLAGLDRTMGDEGRGFRQSPRFHKFLVDLYRGRPAGTTVADLYPQIVAWFEAQDDSLVPPLPAPKAG